MNRQLGATEKRLINEQVASSNDEDDQQQRKNFSTRQFSMTLDEYSKKRIY